MNEKEREAVIEWLQDRGAKIFATKVNGKVNDWNIEVKTELRELAEKDNRGRPLTGHHRFAVNLVADLDRVIAILQDQGYMHDPERGTDPLNDAGNIRAKKLADEVELVAIGEHGEDDGVIVDDFEEEITAKNSNKRVGIKTRG